MGTLTINSEEADFFRSVIGYDATTAQDACIDANGNPGTTIYIPSGFTIADTDEIWNNIDGTGVPAKGWYSDGINWLEWDDISGVVDSGVCS